MRVLFSWRKRSPLVSLTNSAISPYAESPSLVGASTKAPSRRSPKPSEKHRSLTLASIPQASEECPFTPGLEASSLGVGEHAKRCRTYPWISERSTEMPARHHAMSPSQTSLLSPHPLCNVPCRAEARDVGRSLNSTTEMKTSKTSV